MAGGGKATCCNLSVPSIGNGHCSGLGQCEFPSAKTLSQALLTISNVDHWFPRGEACALALFWLAVGALTLSRRT